MRRASLQTPAYTGPGLAQLRIQALQASPTGSLAKPGTVFHATGTQRLLACVMGLPLTPGPVGGLVAQPAMNKAVAAPAAASRRSGLRRVNRVSDRRGRVAVFGMGSTVAKLAWFFGRDGP